MELLRLYEAQLKVFFQDSPDHCLGHSDVSGVIDRIAHLRDGDHAPHILKHFFDNFLNNISLLLYVLSLDLLLLEGIRSIFILSHQVPDQLLLDSIMCSNFLLCHLCLQAFVSYFLLFLKRQFFLSPSSIIATWWSLLQRPLSNLCLCQTFDVA